MEPLEYPRVCQDLCATLFSDRKVQEITGTNNFPDGVEAKSIEELPLVVRESQWIRFEDQYFYLEKEGLYRFANWGKVQFNDPEGRPEVVDKRKSSGAIFLYKSDILNLLGGFAVLTVHGHTHDPFSHEDRLARMKRGVIALTCGSIAGFMCRFLADLGWRTRLFQCLRLEGPYNSYNCGHLLFEFFWPKYDKWVLADVDVHQMFVKDGEFLNMAEVKALIEQGRDFELYPLTPPGLGLIDATESVSTDFIGMSMFDHLLLDPNRLKNWHRQMFAVTAIVEEGKPGYFYCEDAHQRERACKYNGWFKPMEKAAWLATYYKKGL
jgi:hypothetical protein